MDPLSSSPLPAGVVFDCDGTLADTETLSDQAWSETLAARGYTATPADFRCTIGHPFAQNWGFFATKHDLGDQRTFRAELRERFVALFESDLVVYADAVATVRALIAAGVPVAVASSSSHAHVDRVLAHGGLADIVPVVIGADDVSRHKPDPEPYRRACELLGVDPRATSAVEDTSVGITSAVGAGLFTVGVVRRHVDPGELAAANRVVREVTVDALSFAPADPVHPSARGDRDARDDHDDGCDGRDRAHRADRKLA